MRQLKIPRKVLVKHKEAFGDYVEQGLDALLRKYSKNIPYMAYLSCLKSNPKTKRRKSIVICKVKELAQIVKSVVAVKEKYGTIDWKPLEDGLTKLFNYSYRFVCGHNSGKWDTGQYVKSMIDSGVGYCPYCNSHPLETYPTKRGKTHKGALDHFFGKSTYPFLALSIYNLIPVCDQCNHEKGTKPTTLDTHSNPFYDDYHELVSFSVGGKPLEALYGERKSLTISLCSLKKQRSCAAKRLTADLELINRYNAGEGGRIAREICEKGVRYRDWTITDYLKLANLKEISSCDVIDVCSEEFGVRPDGSDINCRPYGKLRNDLMPENVKRMCANS